MRVPSPSGARVTGHMIEALHLLLPMNAVKSDAPGERRLAISLLGDREALTAAILPVPAGWAP